MGRYAIIPYQRFTTINVFDLCQQRFRSLVPSVRHGFLSAPTAASRTAVPNLTPSPHAVSIMPCKRGFRSPLWVCAKKFCSIRGSFLSFRHNVQLLLSGLNVSPAHISGNRQHNIPLRQLPPLQPDTSRPRSDPESSHTSRRSAVCRHRKDKALTSDYRLYELQRSTSSVCARSFGSLVSESQPQTLTRRRFHEPLKCRTKTFMPGHWSHQRSKCKAKILSRAKHIAPNDERSDPTTRTMSVLQLRQSSQSGSPDIRPLLLFAPCLGVRRKNHLDLLPVFRLGQRI